MHDQHHTKIHVIKSQQVVFNTFGVLILLGVYSLSSHKIGYKIHLSCCDSTARYDYNLFPSINSLSPLNHICVTVVDKYTMSFSCDTRKSMKCPLFMQISLVYECIFQMYLELTAKTNLDIIIIIVFIVTI